MRNLTNALSGRARERFEIDSRNETNRNRQESSIDETLLITGAAGLLGAHLTPMLRSAFPDARIIAVMRGAAPGWTEHVADIELLQGDLRSAATWRTAPNSITRVFHLAARIGRDGGDAELALDNVGQAARLVEQCARWSRLRHIVYASSVSVYGETDETVTEEMLPKPASMYAASKLAGEAFLAGARDVRVARLRFSSLYGAGMRAYTVLPAMVRAALREGEITVYGKGERQQDFLHASDAARACTAATTCEADGAFNVGAGVSTTMAELAWATAKACTGREVRVKFDETKPEGSGGYVMNINKAREQLGFETHVDLESGLRALVQESGATSCTTHQC